MVKLGLIIAVIAATIDQLHKTFMIHSYEMPRRFAEEGSIAVTSFYNNVMVWNHGVSFGIFNSGPAQTQAYLLVGLSTVIVGCLLYWLRSVEDKWNAIAIGLVVGGAVGNAIDRLVYGAVADFFDFHISGYHWPAFNIADSFIFIGVFMLVTEGWFVKKKGDE